MLGVLLYVDDLLRNECGKRLGRKNESELPARCGSPGERVRKRRCILREQLRALGRSRHGAGRGRAQVATRQTAAGTREASTRARGGPSPPARRAAHATGRPSPEGAQECCIYVTQAILDVL